MRRWFRQASALALVFGVAGCATGIFSGELAGYDGLATKIRFHYADNALEENGSCRRPTITAITQTEVIEDTREQIVLAIRYRYDDDRFEPDSEDDGFFGRSLLFFRCQGFANRTFTVDKTPDGLVVVEMTGATRQDRDFSTNS